MGRFYDGSRTAAIACVVAAGTAATALQGAQAPEVGLLLPAQPILLLLQP